MVFAETAFNPYQEHHPDIPTLLVFAQALTEDQRLTADEQVILSLRARMRARAECLFASRL